MRAGHLGIMLKENVRTNSHETDEVNVTRFDFSPFRHECIVYDSLDKIGAILLDTKPKETNLIFGKVCVD